MARPSTWTTETLAKAVESSTGCRETIRKLGLKGSGSWLKKKCDELNISYSHFIPKKIKGETSYYTYLGKKIHFLKILDVVQRYNNQTKKTENKFLCECLKCGKKNVKKLCNQVILGKIKTCGCKKDMHAKHRGANNTRWSGCGDISGTYIVKLRRNARARNYKYNLDVKYLWDLFLQQNKKCAYTNLDLNFGVVDDKQTKTASLDRIDNSKGYIKGNVQWVHKKINMMKHTLNHLDFIELCNLVSRNTNNGKN